jgi:hypothetical protein
MEFLTPQDWEDFEEKYPAAKAFLLKRQARNEAAYLLRGEGQKRLTPHELKRLIEFRAIFGARGVQEIAQHATQEQVF